MGSPFLLNPANYRLILVAAASLVFLSGCDLIGKKYTFQQKDPDETLTIQIKFMTPKKATVLSTAKRPGEKIESYVTECDCVFFNSDNFRCSNGANEHLVVSNGELTETYWGQERTYRSSYTLTWRPTN